MCCRVTKILHPKHSRIPTILTYKYPSEYIQRNCENIVEKSEMERNEIHIYIYKKGRKSKHKVVLSGNAFIQFTRSLPPILSLSLPLAYICQDLIYA